MENVQYVHKTICKEIVLHSKPEGCVCTINGPCTPPTQPKEAAFKSVFPDHVQITFLFLAEFLNTYFIDNSTVSIKVDQLGARWNEVSSAKIWLLAGAQPALHFGGKGISFDNVILIIQPWYNFFANVHR